MLPSTVATSEGSDADPQAQPDSQMPCAPHGLVHASVENLFHW